MILKVMFFNKLAYKESSIQKCYAFKDIIILTEASKFLFTKNSIIQNAINQYFKMQHQ